MSLDITEFRFNKWQVSVPGVIGVACGVVVELGVVGSLCKLAYDVGFVAAGIFTPLMCIPGIIGGCMIVFSWPKRPEPASCTSPALQRFIDVLEEHGCNPEFRQEGERLFVTAKLSTVSTG